MVRGCESMTKPLVCAYDVPAFRVAEVRRRHAREQRVGGAELGLALHQVVVGAVDRAQAQGQGRVGDQLLQRRAGRVRLGDADLLEDELEIGTDELCHRSSLAHGPGMGRVA